MDEDDVYEDDFIQTKQPERNDEHIKSAKNLVVEVKNETKPAKPFSLEDDYEDDFGENSVALPAQQDFTSRKVPESNPSHIESAKKLSLPQDDPIINKKEEVK